MELETLTDIEIWSMRVTALIILILTLARILQDEFVNFWRGF